MWDNLLKRLEGVRWEYDGFGRMTERHDKQRGIVQRFHYDDEHRIREVLIEGDAEYTRAQYQYDALGRRIGKQVWRRNALQPECTHFAWSGMQMAGEHSNSKPEAAVQYVYAENSYEPIARVDSYQQHAEVYWYHTENNGLPDRVTDTGGDTVWQGAFADWGRTKRECTSVDWEVPQNLRFQGQYLDRETGLHYNTFRYYDPRGGRYTQLDPIGLMGGLNLYQYVPDVLTGIDPLGLATRLNNGQYNVFQEHTINAEHIYSSDGVQFNRANTEFINRMNTDATFRRDMLGRYPELSDWMKNPNKASSPPGLTWHHHEDYGRLTLVDRADHADNHSLYHPTGKGGREMWGGGEPGRRGKLDGKTGTPKVKKGGCI